MDGATRAISAGPGDDRAISAHASVMDLASGGVVMDEVHRGSSSNAGGTLPLASVPYVTAQERGDTDHITSPDVAAPGAVVADELGSDEGRYKEANRRLELVTTYRALMEGEAALSGKKAAEAMGEDHVTLWRWNKAFNEKGYNGLLPNTDKCGRKSVLQKLREVLGDALVDDILKEIKGLNLDLESVTSSLRTYASSDKCPDELARIILDPNRCSKHALPPSLRNAVKVPRSVRLAHRGPRTLSLGGIFTPRVCDILPGDIFSADDTTPIWAWWVPWEKSDEYPFGVKLLQGQFIPIIDVGSQCIPTFVLIAREKSSYRAADIWHLFGHLFDTIGLPRLGFQLERGSWEANLIRGQEVEYRDDEVTMSRRVGGLRALPTQITQWHRDKLGDAATCFPKTLQTWTSYLPKSKSIEGWFNRNQTVEGTLWGSLGRDQMRKPFEKAKKLYQQCSRPGAKIDPREHFLSGTELLQRLAKIIEYINGEPMEGEVFHGIPRLRFDNALREYPLNFLPEEQRYLYRRNWTTLQITKGYARPRLTHDVSGRRYSLFYFHPSFAAEHDGAEVVVYFDRENFEQPAQIHLARTGEFLCEAQYVERVGSFLDGDVTAHDIRKQWRNAVTSLYSTLMPHAPSRQLPPEIAARRAEAKIHHRGAASTEEKPTTAIPQRRGSEPAVELPWHVQKRLLAERPQAEGGEPDVIVESDFPPTICGAETLTSSTAAPPCGGPIAASSDSGTNESTNEQQHQ